jgi:hypothetical protein
MDTHSFVPPMLSSDVMPKTPTMKTTGTMPRTPTKMISRGTMPRTPVPLSFFRTETTDLCSPAPSTIDLVSPRPETIDLCSPNTPTNASSPNSSICLAPQ